MDLVCLGHSTQLLKHVILMNCSASSIIYVGGTPNSVKDVSVLKHGVARGATYELSMPTHLPSPLQGV